MNESINRSDGNSISSRNEELGNVKGNHNGSGTHDGYSEAGTRNVRVFKKGTAEGRPNTVSQDGRNTGLNEVAPINENTKASSKDGVFSNAQKGSLECTPKMVYHST